LYFSLSQRAKTTYIHVRSLLTVAIMKMHLFFFRILFSLAIATSPGKKKNRRVFLSLVWQIPALYFTQSTKMQSSDEFSLSSGCIAAVPVLAHQTTCNFPNGIQGPRPTDVQLDLCFQIP